MSENQAVMQLFKRAANLQAFAKVGLYGPQGSGKTTTAMFIAQGLAKMTEKPAPIAFIDTETGSDFFVDRMKEAKIPFYQMKTRAFQQLKPAIEEVEKSGAILVIDSVSHFWDELKQAYQKRLKRKSLQYQDWPIVKGEWRIGYATPFVNSRCHIVVAGRMQDIYDDFFDDDGKRDIVKIGSRMRAEKEFGYEPHLVLEMESLGASQDALEAAKDKKERAGVRVKSELIIRAKVIKDRADVLNGKVFDFPTFDDFLPHFATLNLGGEHLGVDTKNSEALFHDGSDAYAKMTKEKTIVLEEIQGELVAAYPGSDKDSKRIKTEIIHAVFETRSWTAVEEKRLNDLREGLAIIKAALAVITAQEEPDVYSTVEVVRHELEEQAREEEEVVA
jgi:hypothetical protein